jgi:PleD family two-component response regulator
LEIFAAAEGQVLEVVSSAVMRSPRRAGRFRAETRIEPALAECSVLLGMADARMAAALAQVVRDEGMRVSSFSDAQEAQNLIAKDRPGLAILEHDPPGIDGMSTCRAIRAHEIDHKYQVPVVMVASQED